MILYVLLCVVPMAGLGQMVDDSPVFNARVALQLRLGSRTRTFQFGNTTFSVDVQLSPRTTVLMDSDNGGETEQILAFFDDKTGFARQYAMNVDSSFAIGWRSVGGFSLSVLPETCREHFYPAICSSPSRRHVVLFGFGKNPACDQVLIWRNGQLQTVRTSHGERVAHFLHSTEASAHPGVSQGDFDFKLLSFGGFLCDGAGCKISNDLWQLAILQDDAGNLFGKWEKVSTPADHHPPPMLLPFLSSYNSTLLVYGGLTPNMDQGAAFADACSLWILKSMSKWSEHEDISTLCGSAELPERIEATLMAGTQLLVYDRQNRGGMALVDSCNVRDEKQVRCVRVFSYQDDFKQEDSSLTTLELVAGVSAAYYWDCTSMFALTLFSPNKGFSTSQSNGIVGRSEKLYDSNVPLTQFSGYFSCTGASPSRTNSKSGERIVFLLPSRCIEHKGTSALLTKKYRLFNTESPLWIFSPLSNQYEFRLTKNHGRSLSNLIDDFSGVTTSFLAPDTVFLFGYGEPSKTRLAHCVGVKTFEWRAFQSITGTVPISRRHHIALVHNDGSLLMYGGLSTKNESLSDIWMLSFSRQDTCEGTWVELTESISGAAGRSLLPRYGHAATTIHGLHYIFGGLGNIASCSREITVLNATVNIHRGKENRIQLINIPLSTCIATKRYSAITRYADNGLLIYGGQDGNILSRHFTAQTALFVQLDFTDLSKTGRVAPFFDHAPIMKHHIIRGEKLYVFSGISPRYTHGGYWRDSPEKYSVLIEDEFCPLGYYRQTDTSCHPCPVGTFSDSLSGECTICPNFTTTSTIGAQHCTAMSPCHNNDCNKHGKCTVEASAALCTCHFGYVRYDNCRVPLVHLAITIASLIVVLAVTYWIYQYKRRNKQLQAKEAELGDKHKQLRVSEKKLDQINAGATIEWDSLNLIKKLASGSFSQVWLAELTDMAVAVKVLPKYTGRNTHTDAFVQEAEVLRSIRHPNIVIFLGAGTNARSKRPFLVMEYLRRGSLFSVLHDDNNVFSRHDRLRFALDAAKGMAYLHGSNPPRLHRDLKSPNLLVSDKWVVKIGDLGTSRFMALLDQDRSQARTPTTPTRTGQEENCAEVSSMQTLKATPVAVCGQLSGEGEQCLPSEVETSLTTPLLTDVSTNHGETYQRYSAAVMTRGVGTLRWKSPESLRQEHYNEKTDVYSYGVVLWEIFTRQTPYGQLRTVADVEAEISAGHGLSIPATMPYDYRHLAEACMRRQPVERPAFPDIVLSLEKQQVQAG